MSIILNKNLELLPTLAFILSALLLFEVIDVHAQSGYLPQDEVLALGDIAKELGKRDWDFNLNPCDNNSNWATPTNQTESSLYKNTVECNCSYPGDVCHVIAMSLESNMFSGIVPAELGKLENLENLILNANNLSGELPVELKSLSNLTELRLTSNNFNGRIPSLESWKQLSKLEMIGSGLEGPIPASISLLSNLEELRISDLGGDTSLFPNLSSMTKMRNLVLRSCNITGKIPDYIAQMSNLKFLDLSFNGLVGDIPNLSGLGDLHTVFVSGNSLNGNYPHWLTNTDVVVDLSYNNFSKETVPQHCTESVNLFRSYAGGNNSDLANCLSRIPCMKNYSSVHINCGGIEVTIGDKVYQADDRDRGGPARFHPSNDHWGFSSTGNVWNVKNYQYTINNVSRLAMKDSELYTTARLSPLSVSYYGRCLKNGRYKVTLHFAEIVFRDDKSYQSLGRRAFDVYTQGAIKLKNFDIKNEAGGVDKAVIRTIKNIHVTNGTLEIRFQYAGKGTTVVPSPGVFGPLISAISMELETNSGKTSIFIVIGAVTAALCLTLIVVGIAWQMGYIGDQISREKDLRGLDLNTGIFTYRQIKAATNNFADSNKLGEGGFGSVYKGTLLDGTLIAVKKLSSKSNQGNREFVNEVGMIAGIQHPNVVRLHGCCVERNQLLLVYEYMENNSLAHALFGNHKSKMEIDFPTRQRICIGIAKGLKFLHEDSVLRMVHRDIKATNVLLDSDLTPKISDFGLAKLNEEENSHITTRVAGTIGYMAPEYALRGHLTYKADVYSFGVLLLEVVAGKINTKHHPTEEFICLVDWVVFLKQKGSLMDLVDPRLGSGFNKKEALRIIEIAVLCINKSPAHRPTMSDVVNMLEGNIEIRGPDINLTTYGDELSLQALKLKLEDIQTPYFGEQETFTNPSSSIKDLYPNSQLSEERC
ncbi:probable leucine-rich repeat receptor-like serine/threonine-protein kinase At3g14840 isoform X4 [Helianthus annuus]|uniref:probable leucine-rich repeat receptor-like serine/threonine-protein kinase At3g14840 isoform X4 n=1 Tax=Helianthus annuus TaxID=4232 RepID=UPI001652EF3A|nr:probable leucine-rich repeat receptor-like serine/threonine-protein kinase At3g14840 isoform X4 [Helianthus annuus]